MDTLSFYAKRACATFLLCAATAILARAQTFTKLADLFTEGGLAPEYMSLVQGIDGQLYGTTSLAAQPIRGGTAFSITTTGTLSGLEYFGIRGEAERGIRPMAGFALGTDGLLYGETSAGGKYGYGSIFTIPSARGVILHSFNYNDGSSPVSGLVLGADGLLYGVTPFGGTVGAGTVFKISRAGTLTSLFSFQYDANGGYPYAALVQASSGEYKGDFYGTTSAGGANRYGTIFTITPDGQLTTIYSFCAQPNCADGYGPAGALIQASDGNFYGTTGAGGANGLGTVFRITPAGVLTTLHSFAGTDGIGPDGLVQATDGNLYGTTGRGGGRDHGTIFEISLDGVLTTVFNFDGFNGAGACGSLVQHTDGTLYGASASGGLESGGIIFSLDMGLGPFVKALPAAGPPGSSVMILGTGLTGATTVSFNGTPATFAVTSDALITATVPAGATTGKIQVVTPGGTLKSNVQFVVGN
jgi:uncharacterized repeat protein (TIGR03803 family)